MPRRFLLPFLLLVLAFALAGCDEEPGQSTMASPEPITDADACHVCGMTIAGFPGPKGQAFMKSDPEALKFCSTLELFTFLKQPEKRDPDQPCLRAQHRRDHLGSPRR